MKLLRRLATLIACAALLLGAATHAAGSTSGIYFMAINDRILTMTPENMPMAVDGALYVPYTMLAIRYNTGINLGVTAQYSSTHRTVLLSDGQRTVTFDLQANNAYDQQGTLLGVRAVVRNSMVFLPVAWLCSYFGVIRFTTNRTPYGTLVRITNDDVILSDAALIDAADYTLRNNLASYQQAISQQPPPASEAPSDEPTPSPTPQPDSGPVVCLAFLWGEAADSVARQLEALEQRTVFFFTADQLARQDDLVRRLVSAGHSIGLDLTGESLSECLSQAQAGSALLSDIARCPAYLVRAVSLSEDQQTQLEQEGWAVWSATLRADEVSSASQLLNRLSYSQTNYVEAACTSQQLSLLSSTLRALASDSYRLYQTTPSVL